MSLSRSRRTDGGTFHRILVLLFVACCGSGAVVGGYYHFEVRPRLDRIAGTALLTEHSQAGSIRLRPGSEERFSRTAELPAGPYGLASDGESFVTCSRDEPWGLLRLRPTTEGFDVDQVTVLEPEHHQTVEFRGITWNGHGFVGLAAGSWFGSKHDTVFTQHDARTLDVLATFPAPPRVGALAWDGSHYWAGTRNQTPDDSEPAVLYQLDPSFRVVSERAAPAAGCQGLAWFAGRLWWADVFENAVLELAVAEDAVATAATHHVGLGYLSGIVHDGAQVWVSEYGDDRLVQLAPGTLGATSEKLVAGSQISPRLSRAARYEGPSSGSLGPKDTGLVALEAHLEGRTLRASWNVHVGEELIQDGDETHESGFVSMPVFARYQITVDGGSLNQPIELEFDAEPGGNVFENMPLAAGLGPGRYTVSVSIHVQYVDGETGPQIVNDSAGFLEIES